MIEVAKALLLAYQCLCSFLLKDGFLPLKCCLNWKLYLALIRIPCFNKKEICNQTGVEFLLN
jgi:hypothetical protein